MLPEIGASELLVIAVVALIVVGPKDLPVLLRKLGQFMAKLRGMASEFRASFDEMARQSELDELRKEVEAMRSGQLADIAAHASGEEVTATFDEISQGLTDAAVQLHPPTTYQDAAEVPSVAKPPRKPRAKRAAKPPGKAAPKAVAKSEAAAKPDAKPRRKAPAKPRRAVVEPGS